MKLNRLILIYSHPIQYFSPLFRLLAKTDTFDTKVLYCSARGAKRTFDKQFNKFFEWDIPLLEGYEFKILKNWSLRTSGFWSLINPMLLNELWQPARGIILVHGWGYFSLLLSLIWGKLIGHTVCLRAESPLLHETSRKKNIQILRKIIFQFVFFPWIDYFWYIGSQNRKFYKNYGVPDRKLIFTPYAVDNERFSAAANVLVSSRGNIRQSLGIPQEARVAVFCGKYIAKKRPMDLLRAFYEAQGDNNYLLMIGEGELRSEMEGFCHEKGLKNVILTGFVNQSKIASYYVAGDFFVMCSDKGETWGLSTNEAMNFGLPVLLSSMTGCREDLLKEGKNGFGFDTGDISALISLLCQMFSMPLSELQEMGIQSKGIVNEYSNETILRNISRVLA